MIFSGAGIYKDLPECVYHNNEFVPRGSLSSTGARELLKEAGPANYRYQQEHRRDSVAFDIGRAVHAKILGVGATVATYPPEHLTPSGNASTKAETLAWLEEQRAAGITVLSTNDHATVTAMTEAVLAHPGARALLEQDGHPETSVFSQDPDTGVWMRARFDYLADIPVDIKTTARSAGAEGFGKSAADYQYPVQEAHYIDTLRFAGELLDHPMHFIVVEKKPPFSVAVNFLPEEARLIGEELAKQAREIYAACRTTDSWPAHPDEPTQAILPAWWYFRHEADEAEIEV